MNLIGSGCVVHMPSFFKEVQDLEHKGLIVQGRLLLSDRAQVVFDLHVLVDGLEEEELREGAKGTVNGKKRGGEIGTTKKGIGPAYSTKGARSGVRVHQVFNKEEMDRRLRALARGFERKYGGLGPYDIEEEIKRFDVREFPASSVAGRCKTNLVLKPCIGLSRTATAIRRRCCCSNI